MPKMFRRLLSLRIRKRRRYRAKNGLYVVPPSSLGKNQIDDISLGGLSFYYVDTGARPLKRGYAVKVMADSQLASVQIPCRTVSDSETGELVSQNQKIKRRSVRFEKLTMQQKKALKSLIKEFTSNRNNR